MRKRGFYPRMALVNLVRNGQFYLPYLLTIAGTAAAYYIAVTLAGAQDLPNMTRYVYLSAFMMIGTFVIAVFAVIFLTYTNSFLMKRRKKELGLYNVLGMGKRHIALVLGFETLYTALIGILGGILLGMLLQKLVTLLLYQLVGFDVYFGFTVSPAAISATVALFGLILLGNLLVNLRRIHGQSPTELMREGSAGEREPKTRWPLAVLGVVSLGAGYFIAVTTRSAAMALGLYFIAVFLVIIGTYCLFTSVSIAVLKMLRRNKAYYYRTNHFISVSGMLYRMKRNAVGLANICILSTMVLVMISATLSLYLGTDAVIDAQYPGDLRVSARYHPGGEAPFDSGALAGQLTAAIAEKGFTPSFTAQYHYLELMAQPLDGGFSFDISSSPDSVLFCLMTPADYAAAAGGDAPALSPGEALVYLNGAAAAKDLAFYLPDGEIALAAVTSDRYPAIPQFSPSALDVYYVVLADEAALTSFYSAQQAVLGERAQPMMWRGFWNVGELPAGSTLTGDLLSGLSQGEAGMWEELWVNSRAAERQEMYSLNGGFFFLGIFLGIIFLMATALIIYYKQISEGYEDRERYLVMQKVGMEASTVRRSVNAQLLVVFFAPLLVAAVHVAFDFSLVDRMLSLFYVRNTSLTLLCTLGALGAFAVVYALVYHITARVYYKLVSA